MQLLMCDESSPHQEIGCHTTLSSAVGLSTGPGRGAGRIKSEIQKTTSCRGVCQMPLNNNSDPPSLHLCPRLCISDPKPTAEVLGVAGK
eukprot:8257010-Prorocentrum_lima.AAC.1